MKTAFIIAFIVSLASLIIWYLDGAWQYGAFPTKGLMKVIGLSALSLFFLYLAQKFKKT